MNTQWPLCVQLCDVTAPSLQTLTVSGRMQSGGSWSQGSISGLCHRLVTIIHANSKHTIHRGVQKINSIKHSGHTVMTALDTNMQSVKHTHQTHTHAHTHSHTHTWGQCGAMAPVLRDMVLICGVFIFRIDCAMPRKCAHGHTHTHTPQCSLMTKHVYIHTFAATAA